MRQFITGPKDRFGNARTVNLKEVTNIAFEEFLSRHDVLTYKIIYNFGYSISLRDNVSKHIPDYNYSVFTDKTEYDAACAVLQNLITEKEWIAPRTDNKINRLINPDKISFVSRDPGHNRIIFNLTTSVSFYNDFQRKTSDFIFLDFKDQAEYESNLHYIETTLGDREL